MNAGSPHPLVYEINTRCWLTALSEKAGRSLTLGEIPSEQFEFWREMGFTHVWLMWVWRTGVRSRDHSLRLPELRLTSPPCSDDDIAGSPYAIAGYEISPALGGAPALQKFRTRLHEAGLKLILDFIPNHLGLDHAWIDEKPELFVQSVDPRPGTFPSATGKCWFAHGKDPYLGPWTDTIQLDYRNPATQEAMKGQLMLIAQLCDGVRCDMAMLLLNEVFARTWADFPATVQAGVPEFWAEAITAVRRTFPEFAFIAEVYWSLESRLQELGFDFTYDKRLYDALVARNAADVHNYLDQQSHEFIQRSVHFLENHDEARIASLLSGTEHQAASLVVFALPGMCLLHEGQLTGARHRLNVHLSRRRPEADQVEITGWYRKLFAAAKHSTLRHGAGEVLPTRAAWPENPTAVDFVIIQWSGLPGSFVLAVANLAPHSSQCRVTPKIPGLGQSDWRFEGLLEDERFERSGAQLQEQGLYLDLREHGTQIFVCALVDHRDGRSFGEH